MKKLESASMRRAQSLFLSVLIAAAASSRTPASDEVPGRRVDGPVAVAGATIHTVSGATIAAGTLVFENGRITALEHDVRIPEGAERIDATGKHIYPGLLDACTSIGLVEIESVRATRDQREVGEINPNVRAEVAVNPDSEVIPVTRSNGVLLALTVPAGGLIAGRSAVLQLDGWTYEDMTLRPDAALHADWPGTAPPSSLDPERSAREGSSALLRRLEQAFEDARAYRKAREARPGEPRDLRWEAMLPVLDGPTPLMVSADGVQEIQAAVGFAHRQGVRLIICGGYDAPHCAELLKATGVPVVIGGVYRLPRRRSDPYDEPFTLPERLRQAGVRFAIASSGGSGASNVRNLPYHAAMAAAFGLPPEEALKAITLYPAEILGVADRVGSLEPGKDATFFIASGDILETTTQVESAYIAGRRVDLSDRHKRLWRKYSEKYRRS